MRAGAVTSKRTRPQWQPPVCVIMSSSPSGGPFHGSCGSAAGVVTKDSLSLRLVARKKEPVQLREGRARGANRVTERSIGFLDARARPRNTRQIRRRGDDEILERVRPRATVEVVAD